nr:hypothetical protein [Tanacetum cinerariifolium]
MHDAILKKKITNKEDMGGNFVIPCNIGGLKHMDDLVDQGYDVNVMPFSIYNRPTNERAAEIDIRLSLAIHLYIYPLGIAEDVLVEVLCVSSWGNELSIYTIWDSLQDITIRHRCIRTELITPNLICPLTYQLLRSTIGDSRPNMSFDRVHLSQLGPLGLNKVITFEVLCRSLQIEPTVTWFRVFQTLCKQERILLIDRRAILDSMVWRHSDAAINDPWPVAGSFSMVDVRQLSAHVIKLRDMPKGVLVLSGLSHVWKIRVCDLVLRVMGIYDFLCLPEWTGFEVQGDPYLDVRSTLQRLPFYCTPSAAADAKRKASTSGATLSHVAKCTRSALAQSFGSTTRPSLFVGDSDDESDVDDDACVEISLVTPFRLAVVVPSSGNQGGSSVAPAVEVLTPEGKGIMVDDVVASSIGASRPRPSSRHAPSFRDVSGDAIHADFFPFLLVLIMPPNPKVFPTPREMVRVENLSDDQLTAKMSVMHCMMMSYGGELLARYRGLNQSHHEYVLSADSRMKGYKEKVASLTGLESKARRKERKKKIKSLTKSLDNLHTEVARLSASLNQATVLELPVLDLSMSLHQTKDEFAAVLNNMANFMSGAQDRLAEVSPLVAQTDYVFFNKISEHATEPLSESTVTPTFESLELSTNTDLTSSIVASEHNEEVVNAEGIRVSLKDVVGLVEVGSGRASSGPNDVVVALSASEKVMVWFPLLLLLVHILSMMLLFVRVSCSEGGDHATASPVNNASQSITWLDALNFKRMAYEYIFSSGLARMILTPKPSSMVSLPRYNLQALGTGSLPSNTVPNPQKDLKVITTRRGVTLAGPSVSPTLPSKEVDRELKMITDQMLEVTKDTVQPSTENIQPPVAQTQVLIEPCIAQNPEPTIPYLSRANKQKL